MSTRPLLPAVSLTLLTACMSATAVTPRADLLGSPVPAHAATRVVNLNQGMQSINVVAGDTVRFVNGSGEFGWSFNTSPIVQTFDLNQVAPNGALGHPVRVYVAPSPLYSERAQFNDNDRQDTRLPAVIR
ncbi:CzcE family metal-binding protein [Massilia sp. Mn16-1_5]|uniref:CzcE family metal-binding protein n=1 Tax=Massilia sp. Mn16-1_5 TaxID=2079199 RepID=UPI001E4F74DE|nr:CzcE family metal-binding protein [Massilia sp. Mn16-1_5]